MVRALSCAFLSLPTFSLRLQWPLATILSPLATISCRPPGPAGSGRAQTLPRWLLPATDCRIAKDRMGLIWPSGPSILLCTEPGNSCGKSKTSCVSVSRSSPFPVPKSVPVPDTLSAKQRTPNSPFHTELNTVGLICSCCRQLDCAISPTPWAAHQGRSGPLP